MALELAVATMVEVAPHSHKCTKVRADLPAPEGFMSLEAYSAEFDCTGCGQRFPG